MITDKDITKLKSVFATKDDLKKSEVGIRTELKRFATKDDLKRFATKDDLKRFATKDDLKRFATKDDLDKQDLRTAKGFEDVQKQITEIKHNILTMEDNILGAINKLQIENSITATYRPKIENHEQRITKLEKIQFAN